MIVSVLERATRDGADWLRAAHQADERAARLAGEPVPLDYKATDTVRTIAFHGYAYTRTPSEVSGALMTRYDEDTPQIWRIPLRDEIVPDRSVQAPRAGYLVPPAYADWLGERLRVHGIDFERIDRSLPQARVRTFRADSATAASRTLEGHHRMALDGAWSRETMDVASGALFVPLAQPKARLVIALLEPQAPDSYAAWGFFNNHFERKEYMEPYVAEAVAREMLAGDPQLKAEFERRLREDAGFAADPAARLDFFYRRHSAWDERYNLYPVYRLDQAP